MLEGSPSGDMDTGQTSAQMLPHLGCRVSSMAHGRARVGVAFREGHPSQSCCGVMEQRQAISVVCLTWLPKVQPCYGGYSLPKFGRSF